MRGQERRAIVLALAAAEDDLAMLEVYVLDAYRQALEDAEAATVEKLANHAKAWVELIEEEDRTAGEHGGQMLWAARALRSLQLRPREMEDTPVEEQDGAKSLVLGRSSHPALDCEVIEEGHDLGGGARPFRIDLDCERFPPRGSGSCRAAGWRRSSFGGRCLPGRTPCRSSGRPSKPLSRPPAK